MGAKRPGREADHSPPSSPEVKNTWGYTAISPYVFMAWCLVKYRIRLQGVALSDLLHQTELSSFATRNKNQTVLCFYKIAKLVPVFHIK
jgi:hypothetical protein